MYLERLVFWLNDKAQWLADRLEGVGTRLFLARLKRESLTARPVSKAEMENAMIAEWKIRVESPWL
jgi:hypothetical protein